jgi:hypothetical protein
MDDFDARPAMNRQVAILAGRQLTTSNNTGNFPTSVQYFPARGA